MNPGIQAIEIMVNGKKNGTGTSMLYNKAQATDMSAMKFMKDGGGASNTTTTDVGQAWDFFMLRITPYSTVDTSFTTGLLQFDDSDSAENISGFEPPTEIVIEDPATRTGYAMLAGQKKDFQLRDSYFFDATLFPQKAKVVFPMLDENNNPLLSYYQPPSGYKDATGTQIVWDAASVDLTAATSTDSEGRRLAGYVYGYALNTVLYAIPVYVTNDFEMQSLKGYYRNADGTYSAKALALDIDKNSSKYMATLPDLVRLQFATGTYTFATYLTDSQGATQYAVINALSGAPKDSNGYQTLPQPTQAEIDAGRKRKSQRGRQRISHLSRIRCRTCEERGRFVQDVQRRRQDLLRARSCVVAHGQGVPDGYFQLGHRGLQVRLARLDQVGER